MHEYSYISNQANGHDYNLNECHKFQIIVKFVYETQKYIELVQIMV